MPDRNAWNRRYDTPDFIHGVDASEFMLSNAGFLPERGVALDLAAGEGRNSIFLAGKGLDVVAVDISLRALEKCIRAAREGKLRIHPVAADLNSFVIPAGVFDVVINFNYLQRDLAPRIVAALKPGGVLIFETLTVDHLRHKPDFSPDYLLKRGELLEMFRGLHLIKYREAEIRARQSARSVASLLAVKNSLEKTARNR
jgi:SAM-dependent methyltransferase